MSRNRKHGHGVPASPEASYICQHCGEEIVIPVDTTQGEHQEYTEDCPVCCFPHLIHVDVDEDGSCMVWAETED